MLVVKSIWHTHAMRERLNKMQFKIAVSDPKQTHFYLDKENADFSHNQIVLNAIVGTLVKYGISGRLEPYLAESWTVSKDKKIWQFKIRPNLRCEDGTPITASLLKETLQKSLKEYSLRGSVIMFDHLMGWSDFLSGKAIDISGLSSKDNIIEFKFDENPDDLLELLRMPYFGLWMEKDRQLISSGPYRLKHIKEGIVTLSLRKEWFTASENSFKEVEISFVTVTENKTSASSNSIVRMPFYVQSNEDQVGGYWISSPPTRLEGFVLSPSKDNFFNSLENRQIFKSRVASLYPDLIKSSFFYPAARTANLLQVNSTYKPQPGVKKLTFALERTTYSDGELENLKKIISHGLHGSQVEFEIIHRDLKDKQWFNKTDSNNYFDSRVTSVDIGAYPNYFVIKMMFCSKLGVNFPDHSGKMCKLVTEGIKSARAIDQEFIDQFNSILHEEAIVIPIFHHSDKWLVSNDFDASTLPATTLYPQFELIRLR